MLLARVNACLRRQREPQAEVIEFGDCWLDRDAHKLFRRGVEVALAPKEFRLIEYFARSRGRALTRQQILDAVWGDDLIVTERSVDRCVNTLRSKIETGATIYIETVRNVGYRFPSDQR